MLCGVFADGLFSPVAKPACERYPARVVLTTALFFTALFLFPFALFSPLRQNELSWQPVASILYLAIPCTCFGWTLWIYFLKKLPVNVIALTVFIQPVVGPFIAHFWLGEQIGSRIWFGGSVIIAAIAIALFKRNSSKEELIAEAVIH